MGNTASNESQQQREGGGGGGSSLNPLSRPRSHGGAPSQPATPGRSSPSWSRHGSLRRGSSQAPSSARASSYFGNLGAVSTDSGLPPPASSSSRRARSRSGSLSTPLASTAQRERAATSTGSPTLSKPSRASSNSSTTGAGPSTHVGRPPTSRRGSAKTPNIDLDDPQSSVDEEPGRRPAPSLSPTLLSPAAFSTHAIISPNPSPSIATDSRHASGTTSYVAPEAAGLSTLEEQTTPTGLTPGGSSGGGGGSSRAFGKGVAAIFNAPIATFAGSMRSDTTSPTSMDEDTADSSIISSSVATGSEGYSTRGSISGPATAEGSTGGRGATAALPSYLKIPTLIPSKQQQPPLPPTASSTPSSPTGSAPGSGNVTPNSSGWSAVAGAPKASTAALNMEEVILKPGSASRVSSPISEEAPLPEEPSTPMPDNNERSSEDTDATDSTLSDKGTASLSRTPTPTQKSHAAKALTPARVPKASDPPSWLPTTEEAAAAHRQRVHIATGLASGATTPVMPIPPGLTSAPPSAGMPMVPSSSGGPAGGAHTTLEDNSTAKRLADLSINVPAATAAPSAPLSSGQKTPTGSTANVSGGSALSPISSSSSNAPPAAAAAGSTTPKSRQPPSHLTPYYYRNARGPISLMPIMLTWRGGGREVFVTGTFANEWRSKILLKKNAPGGADGSAATAAAATAPRRAGSGRGEEHSVVLHLPPGTHRMKFIVDDRWRVSRELPTATDGDGNLVNYLEIPNVGPAHTGPLSAPGEDLVDVEAARERERRIKEATVGRRRPGSSKGASESGAASGSGSGSGAVDVGTAAAVRGGSAGGSGTEGASTSSGGTLSSGTRDRSADTRSSSSKGAADDASTSASHLDSESAHLHQESRRRRAVLDLQEEARRAELVRNGNLEDVFGLDDEALRAAETWVQEVPEGVMRAQQAEEAYRDQCEAAQEGGGAEKASTEEAPQLPLPPSLPRQLEKVILNSSPANPALAPPGGLVDDNSILPAPNHVVLNHLTASAIKGGVLAVGTTTRYKRKYVTTVFYRPVQT